MIKNLKTWLNWANQDTDRKFSNADFVIRLQKGAQAGDAKMQYELGQALYYGFYELEENEGQALKLFEKAAEQEFAEAQQLLGDWYAEGIVVSQNYVKALDLYKRASGLLPRELFSEAARDELSLSKCKKDRPSKAKIIFE